MNIRELKKSAKESLKGKWWEAIGAFVICGVIASVLSGPVLIFGDASTFIPSGTGLSFFITIPLQVGLSWFYLSIYDKEDVEIKQIFDGFKYYGKVLGASLLVGILTVLWTFLFIIPGIIKGISYSQTLYIIRENPKIGIREAIQESQHLMDGYKWTYFLTGLSFIGWYLAPIVTCLAAALLLVAEVAIVLALALIIISVLYLIGFMFYFVPYYSTTFAGFYRELVKLSKTEAE